MAQPPASWSEKTIPDCPRAVSSNTAPAAMLQIGRPMDAGERGGVQASEKTPPELSGVLARDRHDQRGGRVDATRQRRCGLAGAGAEPEAPGRYQVHRANHIMVGRSVPMLRPGLAAAARAPA